VAKTIGGNMDLHTFLWIVIGSAVGPGNGCRGTPAASTKLFLSQRKALRGGRNGAICIGALVAPLHYGTAEIACPIDKERQECQHRTGIVVVAFLTATCAPPPATSTRT
jgi:hypothetical protein